MKTVYISGGQRSGKSRFAMESAKKLTPRPLYLATARVLDEEFKQRVERHRRDRDGSWTTIEIDKHISGLKLSAFSDTGHEKVLVLDCVTLWLTNFLLDNNDDAEKTLKDVKKEWNSFAALPFTRFVISNEIGMGLVSERELGRKFTDLQGFVNQYIANSADEAYFMVSGQALRIK